MNERLYQRQSKEHQQALVESAREVMDWFLALLATQEGKVLEQLKGHGMTVVEPDQAALRKARRPHGREVRHRPDRGFPGEVPELQVDADVETLSCPRVSGGGVPRDAGETP